MKSESRELKKRPQLEVYNRRIETGGREMWRKVWGEGGWGDKKNTWIRAREV